MKYEYSIMSKHNIRSAFTDHSLQSDNKKSFFLRIERIPHTQTPFSATSVSINFSFVHNGRLNTNKKLCVPFFCNNIQLIITLLCELVSSIFASLKLSLNLALKREIPTIEDTFFVQICILFLLPLLN